MPPTALHPGVSAGSQLSLRQDAAEIAVLSPCAETLSDFAQSWPGGPTRLHTSDLASFATQASERAPDSSLPRAILIVLPDQPRPDREAVEAITAFASSQRIAFAVLATGEPHEIPGGLITNLPQTTLRRLDRLYAQHARRAARAILMQLALAAGLSITAMDTPSESATADADPPPSLFPELIEDAAR